MAAPIEPAAEKRPARRSFFVAALVVGITLLLARCSPDLTVAALPNWPGSVSAAGGSATPGRGSVPTLPKGADGPAGKDPTLDTGRGSTGTTTRTDGAPPPTDAEGPAAKGEPTTTKANPPGAVEASFCRHLGMFVQPIRELDNTTVREAPKELWDQIDRIHEGYRDDPDFERHGGADDMLEIWRWAARTCTEPMAGQPARLRLVQFEDQLAGKGPIDVCLALSNEDVEGALADLLDPIGTTSAPSNTSYSNRCSYKVDIGAKKPVEVVVTVRDDWGTLDGSCVERSGKALSLAPADRACAVSPTRGQWSLFVEQRSRSVSIELRWPILDARPPSDDDARAAVEKLYGSIAPKVVLGTGARR